MTDADGLTESEIKQQMREQYREATGEELPDHVVENYDRFFNLGPTIADIQEMQETERNRRKKLYTKSEVGVTALTVGLITGTFAFFVGWLWLGFATDVSVEYGIGVLSVVFAGVGFVIGGLFR